MFTARCMLTTPIRWSMICAADMSVKFTDRRMLHTQFSEVSGKEDQSSTLDQGFSDAQRDSEAISIAGSSAKLVNDGQAILVYVS